MEQFTGHNYNEMIDKDSKILVTGGTGFLGAHILQALVKAGYQQVWVAKRPDSPMDLIQHLVEDLQFCDADINDLPGLYENVEGKDVIIHAAGFVSFVKSDKELLHKINVDGTANIVNVALEKGIKKFIHISSVASLGRSGKEVLIDESAKWNNSKLNSNYAFSKYRGELEVWRAYHEGLPVVILNPSLILGSGYWNKGTGNIVKQVYRGLPYYPPGINGIVDARDVADMCVLLMESTISGERFLCNGGNIEFKYFFEKIAQNLNVKAPKRKLPGFLKELTWRIFAIGAFFAGNKPTVTKETLRSSFNRTKYDNSKSVKELGFKYRAMDETIAYTCDAFKQAIKEGKSYTSVGY
jgi:nucleoside-diphosphate-sugar epimerase